MEILHAFRLNSKHHKLKQINLELQVEQTRGAER